MSSPAAPLLPFCSHIVTYSIRLIGSANFSLHCVFALITSVPSGRCVSCTNANVSKWQGEKTHWKNSLSSKFCYQQIYFLFFFDHCSGAQRDIWPLSYLTSCTIALEWWRGCKKVPWEVGGPIGLKHAYVIYSIIIPLWWRNFFLSCPSFPSLWTQYLKN